MGGESLLKRVSVWVLVVVMATSLIFNYYQHREIQSFNYKQYNMDKELKAQILGLAGYLKFWVKEDKELSNEKYKHDISRKMALTYMAFSYSTYYRNRIVRDAFYRLQYSIENLSIDEAHQVINLLGEVIKPKGASIDIEVCKKLNNYIQ